MNVNISMKPFIDLQHKHISIDEKDNDDLVIDIANLFGSLTIPSKFSVYAIPHHLSSTIFKKRHQIKKISNFTRSFYRSNEEKEIEERNWIFFNFINPFHSISREALESFQRWMTQDEE